jgi:hypothetical protein
MIKVAFLKSALMVLLLVSSSAFAASSSPFPDVPANHWAAKSVADLQQKGVISKSDGKSFNGDQYLTRYEAAVYLDRLVKYMEAAHKPLYSSQVPTKQMPMIPAGAGHDALTHLVKYRFINSKSVLLQSPSNAPVTKKEMTQATAEVICTIESRRQIPPDPDMGEN